MSLDAFEGVQVSDHLATSKTVSTSGCDNVPLLRPDGERLRVRFEQFPAAR
jgi:hypothetical protein